MSKIEIHTSVDDMRCSLKHSEATHTVTELWAAIDEEIAWQKRRTVINLLHSAIRRKLRAMDTEELMKHYPIRDFDRYRWVRYPNQIGPDNTWQAVNVAKDGFIRLPGAVNFNTEIMCAISCNQSNHLVGISEDMASRIIGYSMANSAQPGQSL